MLRHPRIPRRTPSSASTIPLTHLYTPYTTTATSNALHTNLLPRSYFSPSHPRPLRIRAASATPSPDHEPPDDRTLQLGRTIRTLQERMPTLLQSPLPTEILSPSISLHLFPSTHPHLPAVRGRVAYVAALWTAPVAWGKLPGRVTELEVLSERMVGEKLRVRWKSKGSGEGTVRKGTTEVEDGSFSGIFIFEFDEKGRVGRHIIENSEENDGERLGGVITATEWLIRKAKGEPTGDGEKGGLAWQCAGKETKR